MGIEADVTTRITTADQVATDAITAVLDISEIFEDINAIRPPVTVPSTTSTSIPVVTLNDDPEVPDETRVDSAVSVLGKAADEVEDINDIKKIVDDAVDVFDDTVAEVQARIPQITALAANIIIPQETDFAFTEGNYQTDNTLDATLKAIIETEIAKGGEGYSEETETAMYEMQAELKELARQEAIDDTLDSASGTGFSMPQGHHIEAVRKINEQFRLDDEKASQDAMLLQSKLSVENKWVALNAGISYNQIILTYFDTKAQRALDAAISVLSLKISGTKYQADAVRQELEVNKSANKARLDQVRMKIEKYTANLMKYGKQMDGLIALAKGYIDQYRAKAQVYGASVSAAADKSQFDQAENKLSLENQKENIRKGIATSQETLKAFIAASDLKLGSATSGAKIQQAIAMAALDSIGTVVNRLKSADKTSSDTAV